MPFNVKFTACSSNLPNVARLIYNMSDIRTTVQKKKKKSK